MQGIRKLETPWLDRMNRKTIPAKPATQTEPVLPAEALAAVMADHHEKGYDKAEIDRLYKELTGRDYRGRTRAQWDNGETPTTAVDLTQFNYGRCLPWHNYLKAHDGKKPPEYLRTDYLWQAIAERMLQFKTAEWELSMAMMAVRTADNEQEFTQALAKLKAARAANDILGIDATYNQANMPGDPAEIEPENYEYGVNI
jgi:hypothetical protein